MLPLITLIKKGGSSMKGQTSQQSQSLQTRQELKLFPLLQMANVLEMPEDEFNCLTTGIESSPLFRKLHQTEKIIRYQRFPKTDISSHFYQLEEERVASQGLADTESLLLNKGHIIRLIQ